MCDNVLCTPFCSYSQFSLSLSLSLSQSIIHSLTHKYHLSSCVYNIVHLLTFCLLHLSLPHPSLLTCLFFFCTTQLLLEAKVDVERENGQLVANEGALKSQVEQLQTAVSKLQHELQESHRELETTRKGVWYLHVQCTYFL